MNRRVQTYGSFSYQSPIMLLDLDKPLQSSPKAVQQPPNRSVFWWWGLVAIIIIGFAALHTGIMSLIGL